jgi:hypothetical protein
MRLHYIPTGRQKEGVYACLLHSSLPNATATEFAKNIPPGTVFSNFEVRTEGSSVYFLVTRALNEGYCIFRTYWSMAGDPSDHFYVTFIFIANMLTLQGMRHQIQTLATVRYAPDKGHVVTNNCCKILFIFFCPPIYC